MDNTSLKSRFQGLVKKADQLLETIDKAVIFIAALLMAGMAISVLTSVFFRFVLNASLLWGEELTRYLSIWMICLGLSAALRRHEHVSLSSLLRKVPVIGEHGAKVIANLISIVICSVVVWFGVIATINNFQRGQLTPALQLEIGWIYLAVPVGFGLMTLTLIVRLFVKEETE